MKPRKNIVRKDMTKNFYCNTGVDDLNKLNETMNADNIRKFKNLYDSISS